MPLDDGCRFDQHHGVEDLWPDSVEPRPEQTVGGEEPRPARALPTQDGYLVSQSNELRFQRGAAAQPEREQERTADRRAIMPATVWRWYTKRYTCSAFSTFEQAQPLPLPDKPSIAVLPFQNMSADQEQEYFADGMVEDIITALSRTKALFVIARNSTFSYKGKSPDIRQVGRELGVRYVLEGSVRKARARVRITGRAHRCPIWRALVGRSL